MEKEVAAQYKDSLANLTFNSRPVIMNLTEIANENRAYAFSIVQTIEQRMREVPSEQKLPCLYLMDSIMKNHGDPYRRLFQQNIVSTFCHVFRTANEKTRGAMFKLRNTWSDNIIEATKLYQLDKKIKAELDPAWPIQGKPQPPSQPNIHINPAKFGKLHMNEEDETEKMREELLRKERELLELKQKKIELELLSARKEVEKVEKLATSTGVTGQKDAPTASSKKTSSQPTKSTADRNKARDPRVRDKVLKPQSGSDSASGSPRKSDSRPSKKDDDKTLNVPNSSSNGNKSPRSPSQGATPPPPPSIRNEMKHEKSGPIKSINDEKVLPKPRKPVTKGKGEKSETKPKSREGRPKEKGEVRRRDPKKSKGPSKRERSPSSSPSPPPNIKDLGRIPKKQPKVTKSPTPPTGYTEEGPHVEFNQGHTPQTGRQKRRGGRMQGPSEKRNKKELNKQLFGDESNPAMKDLPSPSVGWAKFKEAHPDEYRTPIKPGSSREGPRDHFNIGSKFRSERSDDPFQRGRGRGRGGFPHRGFPPQFPEFRNDFPHGPFNPPPRGMMTNAPALDLSSPMFAGMLQSDPETFRSQVIPVIMEARMANRISDPQYESLMKQVSQVHENVMVKQAERRQFQLENKENNQQMPMEFPSLLQPLPGGPMDRPFDPAFPVNEGGEARRVNRDLPMASEEDLEVIKHDPVKNINIDEVPRDIRYYEETATIVMEDNEIRELSFQTRVGEQLTRRVIIDDSIELNLELDVKTYTDFVLDGVTHKIKIGAPTRELWVDGQWYECFFETSIRVRIGQSFHTVKLEGPAPTVKIGETRPDLCPGRVHLIIDGDVNGMYAIYLDSKPQKVDIAGKPHVLRFVESLKTVLINGHPFRTEFGGYPMVVSVNGENHYVRLTALPKGVIPGKVRIWHMSLAAGQAPESPPRTQTVDEPAGSKPSTPPLDEDSRGPVDNENSNGDIDRLLNLFHGSKKPQDDSSTPSTPGSQYKSENGSSTPAAKPTFPPVPEQQQGGSPGVDVHNLWSQLLGAGLVTTATTAKKETAGIPGLDSTAADEKASGENTQPQKPEHTRPVPNAKAFKDIVLKSHHSTLKTRQTAIVNMLYDSSALQCKTCGLRFTRVDKVNYDQHLDWHFRVKRREKENARRAQSRKWYFDLNDWYISNEIEDAEKEVLQPEVGGEEESTIPIVPDKGAADEILTCPICKEAFDRFLKEEEDDDGNMWYLRNALKINDVVYHPQCYQDLLNRGDNFNESMEDSKEDENENEKEVEKENEEQVDQGVKTEPEDEKMEVAENPVEQSTDLKSNATEETSAETAPTAEPSAETATEEAPVIKSEPTEGGDAEEAKKEEEETTEDGQAVVKEEPVDGTEAKEEEAEESKEESNRLDDVEQPSESVMAAPPKSIKITIKSDVDKPSLDRRESVLSADSEDTDFDPDAIIQDGKPVDEELKPKFKGRKLVNMPMISKDTEMSGLCSIM